MSPLHCVHANNLYIVPVLVFVLTKQAPPFWFFPQTYLAKLPRLALNLQFSCRSLPNSGIVSTWAWLTSLKIFGPRWIRKEFAWLGLVQRVPVLSASLNKVACRELTMLNIMLVVLTRVLSIRIYLTYVLFGQGSGWSFVAGLPAYGKSGASLNPFTVLCSSEEYYRAWSYINISQCIGESPWVLPIGIWFPRTCMEIKKTVHHLLWRPGVVCVACGCCCMQHSEAHSQCPSSFLELQRRQAVHNHWKPQHTVSYL